MKEKTMLTSLCCCRIMRKYFKAFRIVSGIEVATNQLLFY